MTVFLVPIKDGKPNFPTEFSRARFNDWCKLNEGKILRVELNKNPVSDKVRGFYWGAVLPTAKSAIKEWETLNDDDVHEILKKMFNYFDFHNPITKRIERVGRSAMSDNSNTERAMNYIEAIGKWLGEEYGILLPNPKEYKDQLDMAL